MMMCKNKVKRSREKVGWKTEQRFVVVVGSALGFQCRVFIAEFSKIDDAGLGGIGAGIGSSAAVIALFCYTAVSLK